jgi:quinol monooxygenase YgiN
MNAKYVNITCLLFGVALGIIVSKLGMSNNSSSRAATTDRHAFFLGVTVQFKSADEKEEFQSIFRPLADYIRKQELDTLSYEMLDSDKVPNQILILERYKNKKAYTEIHRHSKEFLVFKEKLTALLDRTEATLDGHSYIESNIGFV